MSPRSTRSTRRRRFPWWLLLVAFVVVPIVEIYVIIKVGQVIGAWWTILLLIADSVFGSWLVKREGGRAWKALRVALQQGRMPGKELADGMLILTGGLLMLSPGFVLDIVGVLCILPFTRPLGRGLLARFVDRKLASGTVAANFTAHGGQAADGASGPGHDHRPGPDVVRGDVVD